MTASAVPSAGPGLLAWDASALHHAVLADRADVMLHLGRSFMGSDGRHVTTDVVAQELAAYDLALPVGIDVETLSTLGELVSLANWADIMSAGVHNRGEATVCAWAEIHMATAVMDDRAARRVAQRSGLPVVGTLGLIAHAINRGQETERSASSLVDTLAAHGARFPFGPGGYPIWARDAGLLAPTTESPPLRLHLG